MPQYLSPGVYIESVPPTAQPIAGVGTSTAAFIGVIPDNVEMPLMPGRTGLKDDRKTPDPTHYYRVADAGVPQLITGWGEFKNKFGDFQEKNKRLAHAVYGFFNNGGTRCWITRVKAAADLDNPARELEKFEAIDEIAIVAAPGAITAAQHMALIAHCNKMKDRVAVLDAGTPDNIDMATIRPVGRSKEASYAALYYPWIRVFDPVLNNVDSVPPSGHIAGIYARSDATRGVHKAPANEVIIGALDASRLISREQQDGLNPEGVNVIRVLNGAVTVWGARTLGDTGEFRYVSTRRFLNFLGESIEEGTRWVVFEPNGEGLWKRITRSVSDFLFNQWREGALLGETPAKAFFVKCDKDTNPPSVREAGYVVAEIGVAIVKPAEFVVFRVQQITGA